VNPKDNLPVLALAAGVALLAAEVRRMGRERDQARREFEGLVGRLAERPATVLVTPPTVPPISPAPLYVSDEPYHDELWNEFANANEASEGADD
jgi:hypothetical protein